MNNLISILEILYYLSTILLVVFAGIGLKSIALMRADIKLRNKRASNEKAIEYSNVYLDKYISLANKHFAYCQNIDLDLYRGEVGDFKLSSLSEEDKKHGAKISFCDFWLESMNCLEGIAAAFVNGVADEKTGFEIIGRTYCKSIKGRYTSITIYRKNVCNSYFQNVVKLYEIWGPRLSKSELEEEKIDLLKKIDSIESNEIKPIGVEL